MHVATHSITFKMGEFVRIVSEGLIVAVRVLPNAKRCGIQGIWNNTHLKIALPAPAVDGKANESLIQFLKEILCIRVNDIEIKSGYKARCKTIQIKTNTPEALISSLLK